MLKPPGPWPVLQELLVSSCIPQHLNPPNDPRSEETRRPPRFTERNHLLSREQVTGRLGVGFCSSYWHCGLTDAGHAQVRHSSRASGKNLHPRGRGVLAPPSAGSEPTAGSDSFMQPVICGPVCLTVLLEYAGSPSSDPQPPTEIQWGPEFRSLKRSDTSLVSSRLQVLSWSGVQTLVP
ncbi:hypothetical protein OJAV_G00125920 [Oryzias javanicus]|uniref:Uncharacterized protein n=1 Tax=Oryzias javanicus TaxID=123683 RepID=A0A3S2P1I0_ORYJA|nr:hypothetical protein OJAV_G00125920 [Oryzias javanicus]